MRGIPDRLWWAQRYGGAVIAAGCLFFAVITFINWYQSYQLAQVPVSNSDLREVLSDDATILLLQSVEFIVYVALCVFFVWKSFSAQRRFRRRKRAIEGNQEAMRRAKVKADASQAPALAGDSLEWLWSRRGKPYGVMASEDGLWYYPRVGKRRFWSWDAFRLLEVFPFRGGQRYQEYKLYSEGAVAVGWSNHPPDSMALVGASLRQFEERHQALLDLIAARTGLLPRTFDKRLAEAGSRI